MGVELARMGPERSPAGPAVARPRAMKEIEAAIVGGGPAGLSAALVLGRCRRRTALFDDGRYRNERSHHVHGFLGRDGVPPAELRAIGRTEVARYPTVELI